MRMLGLPQSLGLFCFFLVVVCVDYGSMLSPGKKKLAKKMETQKQGAARVNGGALCCVLRVVASRRRFTERGLAGSGRVGLCRRSGENRKVTK